MGYLVDIFGQNNLYIDSNQIPRIGELIQFIPETFDGQEESITFRVRDIRYVLGRGVIKELPTVILETES